MLGQVIFSNAASGLESWFYDEVSWKITLIRNLESLGQVESQSEGAISEDVESNLRPLPLHVGDEPLQERGGLHLQHEDCEL